MALAGSAAAVALLAVAAVMTWQLAFNSTTSAYAEMAEPGDYVQVEAVIQEAENGQLAVTSAVGDLDVELAARGVNAVKVVAGADNAAALRLYEKCGFVPRARIEVHEGTPSEVLVWNSSSD